MDGAREYILNKSVRERQIPYDFTHMWNLRNKTINKKKQNNQAKGKKRQRERQNQETDS